VAYTWSHALDTLGGIQNSYNIHQAYGNSCSNTPNVFTTSLIYSLPELKSSTALKRTLLGGWKYSDMTTIQSGTSITLGMSVSHSGLASHPIRIAPLSYPKNWRTGTWFSVGSHAQPAAGFFGNEGDGTLLGPGVIDFNMAGIQGFPDH
jgi:hypothetical protein